VEARGSQPSLSSAAQSFGSRLVSTVHSRGALQQQQTTELRDQFGSALCLSGQVRALDAVLSCAPAPSCWHAHVLPALGPNADYFVSTTEDAQTANKVAMRSLLHGATNVTIFSARENLTSWCVYHRPYSD
jgi:hypothetical protein